MVWDKFERKKKEHERQRFDDFAGHFNEAMRERGDTRVLEDFLGYDPFSQNDSSDFGQFAGLLASIVKLSTDDDPRVAMERALMTYKRILEHVGRGGQVKFVSKNGNEKTLKVRVRM